MSNSNELAGLNFINIKCTNFLYETSFRQLFSSDMYVEKRRSYKKFVRFNVDEIDYRLHISSIDQEAHQAGRI